MAKKTQVLSKIAELANYLESRGLAAEATAVDHLLHALAEEDQGWLGGARQWMRDLGKANQEQGSNRAGQEEMGQVEQPDKPKAPAPDRSVLKVVAPNGTSYFPKTVKQVMTLMRQQGIRDYAVVKAVKDAIDPTGKLLGSVSLEDAIKAAVQHGVLENTWF